MVGWALPSSSPLIWCNLQVANDHGALVADVVPDGPYAKAGIERGDIVRFQGHEVQDSSELPLVAAIAPGTQVDVDILRGGKS